MMPEWLLRSENYTLAAGKDRFIDKSILAVLHVLAKIHAENGKSDRFRINTACKVACTLLLVLLLSLSGSFAFVLTVNVYLLAVISLMPAQSIVKVLKTGLVMAAFSLLILLPSALAGNTYSAVMIASKLLGTVTAVSLLSHTARWNSITAALKRFYVPDIFILVLDITIKYLVVLGNFSLNLLYALKLRSIGKRSRQSGDSRSSLSGVAGTMFLKSKEMADEMVTAMECRGFTGEYRRTASFSFTPADFLYLLLHAAFVLAYLYFERN